MLTYPRYADSDSRHAVLDCINSLLRRDISTPSPSPPPTPSLITHALVAWINKESARPLAPSNYFVLLTWIAAAFAACAKGEDFPAAKSFKVIVTTTAVLIDAVVRHGKPGASRSAFVLARRTLRNVSPIAISCARSELTFEFGLIFVSEPQAYSWSR